MAGKQHLALSSFHNGLNTKTMNHTANANSLLASPSKSCCNSTGVAILDTSSNKFCTCSNVAGDVSPSRSILKRFANRANSTKSTSSTKFLRSVKPKSCYLNEFLKPLAGLLLPSGPQPSNALTTSFAPPAIIDFIKF